MHEEDKGDAKAKKFRKIMVEFKEGKLKTSKGVKVTERSQAIAIALSILKKM